MKKNLKLYIKKPHKSIIQQLNTVKLNDLQHLKDGNPKQPQRTIKIITRYKISITLKTYP